jgi:RNA polymerase sigma factor (sigma-70 family)
MDGSEEFAWDPAMVAEAMDGVVRRLRLNAAQAQAWKEDAWVTFVAEAGRLTAHFRGDCSPRTFIGAVLFPDCVDWLRRWKRAPDRLNRSLEQTRAAIDGVSAVSFVDSLVAAENARAHERTLERLDRAIDCLSHDERLLIREHYIERTPWTDLAVRLGCRPSTARQRGYRALMRLRALMPTR